MAGSTVALCAALGAHQRNSDGRKRDEGATPDATGTSDYPMAGRQLRAQLERNCDLQQAQLRSAESCEQSCGGAIVVEHAGDDPSTERRRARALIVRARIRHSAGRRAVAAAPITDVPTAASDPFLPVAIF